MKFLCVPCNEQMTLLTTVSHEEIGSLSVVYNCPACGRQTAMLTNSHETQLVRSLGVRIGPKESEGGAGKAGGAKCPFAAMIQGDGVEEDGVEGASAVGEENTLSFGQELAWTSGAQARLERIPEFIRPMAVLGVEKFAKEQGLEEVDETVLDKARGEFGIGS